MSIEIDEEKRLKQWEEHRSKISSELTAKEIKCVEAIFLEETFDFGNKKKYGRYAKNIELAFSLSPRQDEDHWKSWFEEYLPSWLGEPEYSIQLPNLLVKLGVLPKLRYWPFSKSVELSRFLLGRSFGAGQYKFLKYTLAKHPLAGPRAIQFHSKWISDVYRWLKLLKAEEASIASESLELWISCLPYLHPIYFEYALNNPTLNEQKYLQAVLKWTYSEYSIEERMSELEGTTKSLSEDAKQLIDPTLRKIFLQSLREVLDKNRSSCIKEIIRDAKSCDFVPAIERRPTVELEFENWVQGRDLTEWAKKAVSDSQV